MLLQQPLAGSKQVPVAGLWQVCWWRPDAVQVLVAGVLYCCKSPDAMQRLVGGMRCCCSREVPGFEAGHHGEQSGVHPCPSLPGCWAASLVQVRPAWLPTAVGAVGRAPDVGPVRQADKAQVTHCNVWQVL